VEHRDIGSTLSFGPGHVSGPDPDDVFLNVQLLFLRESAEYVAFRRKTCILCAQVRLLSRRDAITFCGARSCLGYRFCDLAKTI